jgi:hypothetical protein
MQIEPWMRRDPILLAFGRVEALRLEMEWIWSDTGGDYHGEAYQAAQESYDEAVADYNRTVREPYRQRFHPDWRRPWA